MNQQHHTLHRILTVTLFLISIPYPSSTSSTPSLHREIPAMMECPGRIPVICKYLQVTPSSTQQYNPLPTAITQLLQNKGRNPQLSSRMYENLLHTYPKHPHLLFQYATFLEEQHSKDSNHYYLLAFHYGYLDAYEGYMRTLRELEVLQREELDRITKKAVDLRDLLLTRSGDHQEQQRAMDVLQVYHTNALEGSTLSMVDVEYILESKRIDAIKGSLEEVNSVVGVSRAIEFIRQWDVEIDITEEAILEIHRAIFSGVDYKHAGVYRSGQVYVGGHTPPPPGDVPSLMKQLVEWLQSPHFKSLHPIEAAALAHYQLVWIHPFVDGNGRTGRLLMNLILRMSGYVDAIIRRESGGIYYERLQMADPVKAGGDTSTFVQFIGDVVESSIDHYIAVLSTRTHHEL